MSMPKVEWEKVLENVKALNVPSEIEKEFLNIARLVVKKNGEIRASKPKVSEFEPVTGKAAYVWRMVAFSVSPKPAHQCIPVCADFDLPAEVNGKWSSAEARIIAKGLAPLENAIVQSIPKDEWHGVHRWAKAMGKI